MTLSTTLTSPLPVQHTWVIIHRETEFLLPATIVPLDSHNSRMFGDWDLEEWEVSRKLEWYRFPFIRDLLVRQVHGYEKTFVLLTRLADFPRLVSERLDTRPPRNATGISVQIQAALTAEIQEEISTTIYNIETAPWNKFGPDRRVVSLPAAGLFFFAAQHHLATTSGASKFIVSHPTDDGVLFYQQKLKLDLRWNTGLDHYAVVGRESLYRAFLRYKENLESMQQNLPIYQPD
ncbi:MAG: hypothetical protein ACLFVT_03205 [Syntrophobacteria bacterium]